MTLRSGSRRGSLRPSAFAAAVGIGLAVLAGSGRSLAQPSPDVRAAAAALFDDARRLMGENKFAEACPKLEESQRLDPGIGTLYQLSACFEATGRTASAWVGFREAANLALNAGQPDREKAARGRAAALEPKLIRIKITAAAGVEVKRDGAVVSPALWGTPVPLDPGPHKVSASAPGKEPWETTVSLDQPGGTVNVEVPPLQDKKPGAAVVPVGPQAGPVVSTGPGVPSSPVEGASPRPWQMPLGIVATILGVGGIGAGIGLGVVAKGKFQSSNDAGGGCTASTNACNPAGLSTRSTAVTLGNAGTGAFFAGLAFAGAGVALLATAPRAPSATGAAARPQAPAASASLEVGLTGASLRVLW